MPKQKLTDIDKLKYWLDAELTLLHIMFAVVAWLLTNSWFVHTLLVLYVFISSVYMFARLAYLSSQDVNYLKIPKK